MKIRLSKRSVDAVKPPADGQLIAWDDDLKGFGVRVSPAGRKTFFVQRRTQAGREIKIGIGTLGDITADQARRLAGRELARLANGNDPVEERRKARAAERARRAMPTVAELAERFLSDHVEAHNRTGTLRDYRQLINSNVVPKLGDTLAHDVTQADIADLHHGLRHAPYVANRTVTVLHKMFAMAIVWGLRNDNPAKGIKRYHEQRRERYLSADELVRLTQVLAAYPYRTSANAIRMLLLTGARRGEVLAMRWADIEDGVWTKPAATTKQKRVHRLPLSPGALQLIEDMKQRRKPGEPYVFPGKGPGEHLGDIKKAWAAVTEKAGIGEMVPKLDKKGKPVVKDGEPVMVFKPSARLHDLRHTYASVLASSNVSLHVIGSLLGHTQLQTTARYAHLFHDPLQEATNRVSTMLDNLATGRSAEITPLRRR